MLLCQPCFIEAKLEESLTMGLSWAGHCDKCKRWIDPKEDEYNWIWNTWLNKERQNRDIKT